MFWLREPQHVLKLFWMNIYIIFFVYTKDGDGYVTRIVHLAGRDWFRMPQSVLLILLSYGIC